MKLPKDGWEEEKIGRGPRITEGELLMIMGGGVWRLITVPRDELLALIKKCLEKADKCPVSLSVS